MERCDLCFSKSTGTRDAITNLEKRMKRCKRSKIVSQYRALADHWVGTQWAQANHKQISKEQGVRMTPGQLQGTSMQPPAWV